MISIALPMVVSSACETVMIFTDRIFLSKLGLEQMSAAMGGGLSVYFIMSFFVGLLGYSTAMTAQFYGAGQKEECPKVLSQSVLIAVCAYPLILMAGPLMHKVFAAAGINKAQLGPQLVYFDLLLYTSVFGLTRGAFSNFFSGIGKTRVVMVATFGAMLVNVFASYVLIFGKLGFAPMGIRGAAVGTIIANLSGVAMLLFAYLRRSIREEFSVMTSFRIDAGIIKKLFRFGTPSGIEFFMAICAFNFMIMLFHSHSPVTASAATIMFNWDLVSFIPLLGVEIGVTSLVGRYVGAGRHDLAERSVRSGLKLGWSFSAIILVLFIFFPALLADVFKPAHEPALFAEAEPLAVFMLRLAAIYVTQEAVMVVYMGALKGAGDTLWSMIINISFNWFILAVLYTMLRVAHLSAEMSWIAVVVIFVFMPLVLYLRFRSGGWKRIQPV